MSEGFGQNPGALRLPGLRLLTGIQNTAGATVVGLSYDAQGNLSNKNGQLYSFSYGNRLLEVPGKEYYRYDGQGRRVMAWVPTTGSILTMYSQSGQPLFAIDERRHVEEENIYLNGSLLTIRERDQTTNIYRLLYQHTDALGSPVAVTDATGAVTKRNFYEPYGAVVGQPTYQGIGYTGHVQDAATGLTHMQQRYYDPQLGRFLSVDPVTAYSLPGSNFNRYWYANNNPYKFADPDGRFIQLIWGGVIGAGVEIAAQKITNPNASINWKSVGVSAAVGAATGGVASVARAAAVRGTITVA